MREFSTGATRDNDETKNDYEGFMSPHATKLFGDYMTKHRKQADGKLRDSDNWQKGIPRDAYMKSAWRHFLEVWTLHREYVKDRELDPVGAPSNITEEMLEAWNALKFNVDGYLHEMAIGRDAGIVTKPVPQYKGGGLRGFAFPPPKPREHRFDEMGESDQMDCGQERFHPVTPKCLLEDGSESTTSGNIYRDRPEMKWQHRMGLDGDWHDVKTGVCFGGFVPKDEQKPGTKDDVQSAYGGRKIVGYYADENFRQVAA